MKNKKILVVLGGNSKEREISNQTGKACYKAMIKLGYKAKLFDPKKNSFSKIDKKKVDVIFNALHGEEGEDGLAQSFFEYLKIPYTHSGVLSSMNAMNKEASKKIFLKNKIKTPKYVSIDRENYNIHKINLIVKKYFLKFPIVVKPLNEGSSIGVRIVKNLKELKISINSLFKIYKKLLIEKYIGGQEIQVAVINGKALGAIELIPKRKFYDYKAKYSKSARTNHVMPAKISPIKYREVLKIAEKTHRVLKCRGVTRSDFKFYNNNFYLLELNTQPGMTKLSLVPEIADYCGISFNILVKRLLQDASINR